MAILKITDTTKLRDWTTTINDIIDALGQVVVLSPDDITTIKNDMNKIISKDIAINGDITDLASARGLFDAHGTGAIDFNTLTKQGIYAVPQEGSTNGPGFSCRCLVFSASGSYIVNQIAIGERRLAFRYKNDVNNTSWTQWKQIVSEYNIGDGIAINNGVVSVPEYEGATSSSTATSGLVPPALSSEKDNFLKGDGTWGDIGESSIIATGSDTPRTLADRFGDVVNVRDFGALGDGVTDDTEAIQAAIDACSEGSCVVFPIGTYFLSYAVFMRVAGVKVLSLGAIIKTSYNGTIFLVSADRILIDGFSFIGDGSLDKVIGVYFQKSQFSTVQNCYFYRMWRGVQMGNERAGDLITLRCHVLNNYIAGCLGIGVCTSNSRYPKIAFNKIRDSGSEHITLDNQTYYAEIHTNTMYGSVVGSGAIGMDGGSMAVITGNHIQINNPNKPAIAMNGHTDPTNYCVISGNFFEGFEGSTVPAIWLKGGSPVLDPTLDNDVYGSSYNIISDNIFRTFKNGIAFRPYSGHNKIGKNQYINITEDKIVDENGTNDIGYSNYVLPSKNKISVSFPDDGTTITAPANGWYAMVYQPESGGSALSGWLDMANLTASVTTGIYLSSNSGITGYRLFLPVKKGDIVRFDYPSTPRSDSLLYFVTTDDVQ